MSTEPATTDRQPRYAPPEPRPSDVPPDLIDTSDARVVRITAPTGAVLEVPRRPPGEPPGREHLSAPAFARQLSLPAQEAFARADAFRRAAMREGIDLEHLLVGLHGEPDGPARRAFAAAGLDYAGLDRRLRALGYDAPRDAEPHDPWRDHWGATTRLDPAPLLSRPVLDVLLRAEELASVGPATAGITETRHLLHALTDAGERDFLALFGDVWPHLEPLGGTDEPPVAVAELDDPQFRALVGSLSVSTRRALGVADAFRRERGADAVHMEHLVLGTHAESGGHQWYAFDAARLSPEAIAERLARFELRVRTAPSDRDNSGTRLEVPRGAPVEAMPPLSAHARLALSAAAHAAGWTPGRTPTPGLVQARHLLTGIFSVRDCTVVQALADARPAILASLGRRIDQDIAAGDFSAEMGADQHGRLRRLLREPPGFVFQRLDAEGAMPRRATPLVGAGRGGTNDRAVGEDRLGFHHYVSAFADLIDSPDTSPPLTIGIFGAWGAGKSFILRSLAEEMRKRGERLRPAGWRPPPPAAPDTPDASREREPRYVYCVDFNAWEYNAADLIWPRLVRRVLDTVDGAVRWNTRSDVWRLKVRRKLRRNLASRLPTVGRQLLAGLAVAVVLGWIAYGVRADQQADALQFLTGLKLDSDTFTLTAVVAAIATLAKLFRETILAPLGSWVTTLTGDGVRYGAERDYMGAIRSDLDLLGEQLAIENARVLVIIDDLDRCEPEKAVEILQAINLLLDREQFVVCLGIDARIITAAVERHYRDLLGPAGLTGYEYLDKIVQIPFRIPEPTPADLAEFLSKQMGRGTIEAPVTTDGRGERPPGTVVAPSLDGDSRDGTDRSSPGRTDVPTPPPPAGDREPVGELTKPGILPPSRRDPGRAVPPPPPARRRELTHERTPRSQPVLSFSSGEFQAFSDVTRYLRPNPRHVKRLVNVYALVRSLADLRGEERVLDDPGATVRWLTLCGQWPYATRELLRVVADVERGDAPPLDASGPPLAQLLARAAPALDPARRRRFDHSPELLADLVATSGDLSWDELLVLRHYTVNFNPALESELRTAEPGAPRTSAEG